jgi:hypothetical protein
MAFRIGQRVVCIDASPSARWTEVRDLVLNRVYKIAGFDDECPSGAIGLHLVGVPMRTHPDWRRPIGWRVDRFRPVVERKTDISALQALLAPGSSIREDA